MKNNRRLYWRCCYGAMIGLSVLVFTPLVTPPGTHEPSLGGVPYTLWTGILVAAVLVVLTFVATRVYPPEQQAGGEHR